MGVGGRGEEKKQAFWGRGWPCMYETWSVVPELEADTPRIVNHVLVMGVREDLRFLARLMCGFHTPLRPSN